MVGCIGHTHQVLVGPAVHVGVLLADDAVASVAGLALAAVHGVAVMAHVVAFGVTVAVVRPICAWVVRFAHLRGQHPDVNAEPSRVSRYHRSKKNPDPYHVATVSMGKGVGYFCPSPCSPAVSSLQVNNTALCVSFLPWSYSSVGSQLIREQRFQM